MSCVSPKKIVNRKADYQRGIDAVYQYVPCGKCEGCQEMIRNEWFLRCYYHWLMYRNLGGYTMFVTLTYNDESIPTFHYKGEDVKCFSKFDIQDFMNALRKYFERHYNVGKNGSLGISYFIAGEYGSETKRPHYHGLIYFPCCGASFQEMKEAVHDAWDLKSFDYKTYIERYKLSRKRDVNGNRIRVPVIKRCKDEKGNYIKINKVYGKRGFIKYSDKGAFVDSVKGIKYAAKYAGKDLDFYRDPRVKGYLSELADLEKPKYQLMYVTEKTIEEKVTLIPGYFDIEEHKRILERVVYREPEKVDKWFLPRHYQSKEFGLYMLDTMTEDEFHDALQDGVHLTMSPDDTFRYSVPRYIHDKLYYENDFVTDTDDNVHSYRYLTSFGVEHEKRTRQQKIIDTADKLRQRVSLQGLTNAILDINHTNHILSILLNDVFDFRSIHELQKYILDNMNGYDFEEVAVYKLFLRGRVGIDGLDYNDIADLQLQEKSRQRSSWCESMLKDKEFLKEESKLCNLDSREYVLQILDVIYTNYNFRKAKARSQKQRNVNNFRHKYLFV